MKQSSREVPIAYEVDLLILGGSSAAVAVAEEAAGQGARVLLLTQYPYLGEDRAATLQLLGEEGEDRTDPLVKKLDHDPMRDAGPVDMLMARLNQLTPIKFSYKIEGLVDPSHPEIAAPGRLADRKYADPVRESLQVNGHAVISAELESVTELGQIVLMAFRREKGENPFEVDQVLLSYSTDGVQWTKSEASFTDISAQDRREDQPVPFVLAPEKPLKAKYLKLEVRKKETVKRVLLGELMLFSQSVDLTGSNDQTPAAPRPMHVKRVLDETLLQAGVPFLFNTFPVGRIQDKNGTCYGAVISNRGGRQAVLAKKVLDTRVKALSLDTARFIVIGAEPVKPELADYPNLKSVTARTVSKPFIGKARKISETETSTDYPIVEYSFELNVSKNAFPESMSVRAELEKQIRLATYSENQSFTADEVIYPHEFRPIPQWRALGRQTASEAKEQTLPPVDQLTVVSDSSTGSAPEYLAGDVKETLGGLRTETLGFQESKPMLRDPERAIPVLGHYDVLVVGGGTSGAPAGIAAARNGAKTLVLEHLHDLGGIGTAGAISIYWYGNVTGFTKEVQDGIRRWSIESKIQWWRSKLAQAGAEVWYGVLATGAVVDQGRVRGVLVATPFGLGIVQANIVIDATGNGDIAVAAGSELQIYHDREIAVQGAGLAPRNLGASYTNTDFMFVDENDPIDSSHVFVYAKEKYPRAFDQGKLLSTRERRQILGEFSFTVLDQINHRTYPDSIVYAYSDYDTHGYTIDPYMELNHPYRVVKNAQGHNDRTDRLFAYVPYRSSIPQGLDGILVVGLAMSSHRDALPIVRMQPDLQNQGYAIGWAAATLARTPDKNVRDLNVRELQKHLIQIGNLAPAVAEHEDNYGKTKDRLPEAVQSLPDHFRESVPMVMWYPEESKELVHQAYLKENDFERKLIYAKVAAALGDPIGVPTLLEKLNSYDQWDKGWEFTGMGQAGAATSPMDQIVMILGRTGDPRAVDEIAEKAALLKPTSEFSHLRAVALALENIGGEKSAQTLLKLLEMPNMTGYVHDSIEKAKQFDEKGGRENTNQEKSRRDSLVEISLARALYRCGDLNGKAEQILKSYKNDLRGHFSRHAKEILK